MRTFVSVSPPVEVREKVRELQEHLAQTAYDAGLAMSLPVWSAVEKMHLTLRFLGEMRADQRTQMEELLRKIAGRHTSFPLTLQGVGAFPNWRKPSVVWLGFAASSALLALQTEVEAAAQTAGFAADTRAFTPHLTLAYVHRKASAAEARELGEALRAAAQQEEIAMWRQTFVAHTIELMRSELLPGGAHYSVLASEHLR